VDVLVIRRPHYRAGRWWLVVISVKPLDSSLAVTE